MKNTVNNAINDNELYKKMGSALNNLTSYLAQIHKKITGTREAEEKTTDGEFASMLCPLTGALNRIGLRNYFDQIVPSELLKTSLVFIEIDFFEYNVRQLPNDLSDKYSQQIVSTIIELCGSRDILARWSFRELVLVCPEMPLPLSVNLGHKISRTLNKKRLDNGTQITCNAVASQASGADLQHLIDITKKELLKLKKVA